MGKFRIDLENERLNIRLVYGWLEKRMNVEAIEEASLNEQISKHVDFHGYLWGEPKTFEAKIRHGHYDDLLIETLSCKEQGTLGWIYTSQADVLVYFFVNNQRITKGLLIDLQGLKRWWISDGSKDGFFVKYYGETEGLYRTENVAVPLQVLPKNIVYLKYTEPSSGI